EGGGVDGQGVGLLQGQVAAHQAEEVAGREARRPKDVLAAGDAGNRIVPADPLVGPERDQAGQGASSGLVRADELAARRQQLPRDLVLDIQPGEGQELAIDDFDLQVDRLAKRRLPPAEAATVLQAGQAIALVEPRQERRQQQRQRQQEERRLPRQQAEEQKQREQRQRRGAKHHPNLT